MLGGKLTTLLKCFSKEEWKSFSKFVHSPYFNSRPELAPILDYLQTQAPVFSEETMSKSALTAAIPLPKALSKKEIAHLMNYLLKLAEQFIGQQYYESNTTKMNFDKLHGLVNRNLDQHYEFLFKKVEKDLQETQLKERDFFLLRYELSSIADRHFIAKDERRFDTQIQEKANNLDLFYISQKLKTLCELVNRQRIFQQPYQLNLVEELLGVIQNPTFTMTPYITCYQHILKMQLDENADENFKAVKTFFQLNADLFSKEDQSDILSHILNYCIQQIRLRAEKTFFMEEALTLYLLGIQKEILLENGILSPWHFKNIISLFTNLKKFKAAALFIREHAPKLESTIRENTMHYNLATLDYNLKDYEGAIEHLQHVKFTDIHYHLNSRLLLLQIYYEQDEDDALRSLLASFSIFLKRNKKISTELKTTYLNFCKILKAILRRNPQRIDSITERIEKYSPLAARQWLKEMIAKEEKG